MNIELAPASFEAAYAHFLRLIAVNDKGRAFTNFREGVAGV